VILGIEIGMLVMGIIALVTGKLTLSKKKVVYGTPAKLLAIPLLLPIPLAIFLGLVVGVIMGLQGINPTAPSHRWVFALLELGPIALCMGIVYAIGWNLAESDPSEQYTGLPNNRP
jgi:hypothetical protein